MNLAALFDKDHKSMTYNKNRLLLLHLDDLEAEKIKEAGNPDIDRWTKATFSPQSRHHAKAGLKAKPRVNPPCSRKREALRRINLMSKFRERTRNKT